MNNLRLRKVLVYIPKSALVGNLIFLWFVPS